MRDLVHGLKYADRHESAGMLAGLLQSAGGELLRDTDLILPVPLHRSRLWKRRFNQAALLAHRLSAATGIPAGMTILRRIKPTASQVELSRDARRSNVASAFALGRGAAAIAGKRVLLIDDVITTGATLDACAKVLKAAGAVQVDCLALAITLSEDLHLT
jgi:ComF family protein